MSDTIDGYLLRRRPTAARPLLGLTVLVVEDSRFASEAVRLMCLRSGARIRRADCLCSAHKHLRNYRPSVAIVDLGLPDGDGEDLIRELVTDPHPMQVVLATSGAANGQARARQAGAQGYLEKPIRSLGAFQQAILSRMPREFRPLGLRTLSTDEVVPDMIAFRDDIAHVAELLNAPTSDVPMAYISQFLTGIARTADDQSLFQAAAALGPAADSGSVNPNQIMDLRRMIDLRLADHAVI